MDLSLNSAAGPGLVAGAISLGLAVLFAFGLRYVLRAARASGRASDWLGAALMLLCLVLAAAVASAAVVSAIMSPVWL